MTTAANIAPVVATGAADKYLTFRPSVTFFKLRVNKCTNFAMETVSQTVPNARFGASSVSVNVMRTGDLLFHTYLKVTLPSVYFTAATDPNKKANNLGVSAAMVSPDSTVTASYATWVEEVGHALIKNVKLTIGGQEIDRISGKYMHIAEEMGGKPGKELLEMVGKHMAHQAVKEASQREQTLYVPLPFWFTLTSGNAIPLVALQFHSLHIEFSFENLKNLIQIWYPDGAGANPHGGVITLGGDETSGTVAYSQYPMSAELYGSYVYLDQLERDMFATGKFLSLINIHQEEQFSIDSKHKASKQLTFNFPTKALYWVVHTKDAEANNKHFDFTHFDGKSDPVVSSKLTINGMTLCDREAAYYRLLQPYQCHTKVPIGNKIYMYSFALKPESEQPSGSLNLSRIDNISLHLSLNEASVDSKDFKTNGATCYVFARSWNILRFGDGLAGPMFGS